MIKIVLIMCLISLSSVFAKEYMTQINPNEKIEIKSEISGVVKWVEKDLESSFVKTHKILLQINSRDEEIELQKQKQSLSLQKELVRIKEKNYQAKNKIKQLSLYDKNNEKLSFLESKKELILIQQNIKKLLNEIDKKVFVVENKYINTIFVKKDTYVNIGDKLFDMYDISKLKITLYLTENEIKRLDKKAIFVDGVKSDFTVNKINKIKDEIKVSRYKVEFTKINKNLDNYFFNKVVKVEIK
ncbi:MAG: hypothetical protein C0625_13150 [Arcobacter sp.]|nr:MAG: hypothetical protein C0625_13150 [Arcobacter sp.]